MNQTTIEFAADHPTGAGHFPGNPIIPGALLLAETIRAIAAATGTSLMTCNIKAAKFLYPVRPGQSLAIAWDIQPSSSLTFTGAVDGRQALSGSVAF